MMPPAATVNGVNSTVGVGAGCAWIGVAGPTRLWLMTVKPRSRRNTRADTRAMVSTALPPVNWARKLAPPILTAVSYTHLRAHETPEHLVCRLLLEKKKK